MARTRILQDDQTVIAALGNRLASHKWNGGYLKVLVGFAWLQAWMGSWLLAKSAFGWVTGNIGNYTARLKAVAFSPARCSSCRTL